MLPNPVSSLLLALRSPLGTRSTTPTLTFPLPTRTELLLKEFVGAKTRVTQSEVTDDTHVDDGENDIPPAVFEAVLQPADFLFGDKVVGHRVEKLADLGESWHGGGAGIDDADAVVGRGRGGLLVGRVGFPCVEVDSIGWLRCPACVGRGRFLGGGGGGRCRRWGVLDCSRVGGVGVVEGNQTEGTEDVCVASVQSRCHQRSERRT